MGTMVKTKTVFGIGRGRRARVEKDSPMPGLADIGLALASPITTVTPVTTPTPITAAAQAPPRPDLHTTPRPSIPVSPAKKSNESPPDAPTPAFLPSPNTQLNTSTSVSDPKSEYSCVSLSAEDEEDRGTLIAMPLAPGKAGTVQSVTTNLYDLAITDDGGFHRYRVDVYAQYEDKKDEVDLGKGMANDHLLNRRRELCWSVFQAVVEEYPDVFPAPATIAYDRRNLLVSKNHLSLEDTDMGYLEITADAGRFKSVREPAVYKFKLTYESKLNLKDLSGLVTANLEERDRQVVQMLEIIINQVLYSNESLVHFGCKSYNRGEVKGTDLGCGRFFAAGVHHSLTVTSHPQTGEPILSLLWDSKSGAFFKPQKAIFTLCETLSSRRRKFGTIDMRAYTLNPIELKKVTDNFRDVNVQDEATQKDVTIDGMSKEAAKNTMTTYFCRMTNSSKTISVADYYRHVLNRPLEYPDLQCFYHKTQGGKRYHPVEVCVVNECQRVPLPKQNVEQMQAMIKQSVKAPSRMQQQLAIMARESNIFKSQILKQMSLQMEQKARIVKGRVIPAPSVKYGAAGLVRGKPDGDWRMPASARFVKGGSCTGWQIVAVVPLARSEDAAALAEFSKALDSEAKKKGLTLGPGIMASERPEALETLFKSPKPGIQFILFVISDDKDSLIKDRVKMMEHKYGIITQCVTYSKAIDIGKKGKGYGQVLENVLNKTNMKLGGVNYHLSSSLKEGSRWLRGDGLVMLMGVDVNHPPPQPRSLRHFAPREPSVVGMVANSPDEAHLFTGEIDYQSGREEMVMNMHALATVFAKRWLDKTNKLPLEIVYFRDGISDGQFQYVLIQEVDKIRAAFKAASPTLGYSPRITAIVAKKRHNLRMFNPVVKENVSARAQDLPPGTVLDAASGITHPGQANCFLKSHSAIQGTARAAHYTLLLNEGGYSQDEMDDLIYTLAHNHQIVSKPVSIPAPVFGGHEMAERGKRIFRAHREEELSSGSGSDEMYGEDTDWSELSRRFAVSNHPLLARAKHWA